MAERLGALDDLPTGRTSCAEHNESHWLTPLLFFVSASHRSATTLRRPHSIGKVGVAKLSTLISWEYALAYPYPRAATAAVA